MAKVTSIGNPVYADETGKRILCTVEMEGHEGIHPHIAADGDKPTQQTYDDLKAGKYGEIKPYVADPAPAPAAPAGPSTSAAPAVPVRAAAAPAPSKAS